MESARILVAIKNEAAVIKLKALRAENQYEMVDHANDANECLRKMRMLKPDLAILDYDLSPMNGLEIARIATEDKLCDVILLVGGEHRNSLGYMKREYDFAILIKPLNKDSFISTVDLVIKNRKKINKMEREIEELKKTLDARKDIERAKGILMKHLKIGEEEAFRKIQKQSMDMGIPMREIAKSIILNEEFYYKGIKSNHGA